MMMAMTVQKLISLLQKMPKRAVVVFAAHDQNIDAGEFDGYVNSVGEAPDALKERGIGVVLA